MRLGPEAAAFAMSLEMQSQAPADGGVGATGGATRAGEDEDDDGKGHHHMRSGPRPGRKGALALGGLSPGEVSGFDQVWGEGAPWEQVVGNHASNNCT